MYLKQIMSVGYTFCTTRNVISHAECSVPLHQHFRQFVCSAQYGCLLYFFPGMLLKYCVSDFEMVPAAPIIIGITFGLNCTCAVFRL